MKKLEKINFEGLNDEQIEQAIINKDKKEFCVIYDFLETKKNEKLTKERTTNLKSKIIFFLYFFFNIIFYYN